MKSQFLIAFVRGLWLSQHFPPTLLLAPCPSFSWTWFYSIHFSDVLTPIDRFPAYLTQKATEGWRERNALPLTGVMLWPSSPLESRTLLWRWLKELFPLMTTSPPPPPACVLVPHSCPALCSPMGCSTPGSSVHGILQARILERVTIPFSRGSSWPRDWAQVSCSAGWFFTKSPGKPSQVVLLVKNPPANAGDIRNVGSIPGFGRSLGRGNGTNSSVRAWRIPWTEPLVGYSPWGSKDSDMI